jgi:hypothetical protein
MKLAQESAAEQVTQFILAPLYMLAFKPKMISNTFKNQCTSFMGFLKRSLHLHYLEMADHDDFLPRIKHKRILLIPMSLWQSWCRKK